MDSACLASTKVLSLILSPPGKNKNKTSATFRCEDTAPWRRWQPLYRECLHGQGAGHATSASLGSLGSSLFQPGAGQVKAGPPATHPWPGLAQLISHSWDVAGEPEQVPTVLQSSIPQSRHSLCVLCVLCAAHCPRQPGVGTGRGQHGRGQEVTSQTPMA